MKPYAGHDDLGRPAWCAKVQHLDRVYIRYFPQTEYGLQLANNHLRVLTEKIRTSNEGSSIDGAK